MYKSKVDVVLGAQWGDEGKGKVVDMLALDVDIVCRCQVSLFLRSYSQTVYVYLPSFVWHYTHAKYIQNMCCVLILILLAIVHCCLDCY